MNKIALLLRTYQLGDRLSDAELSQLGDHMTALAEASRACGDMFLLQAIYAQRVAHDCRDFLKHRTERRNGTG